MFTFMLFWNAHASAAPQDFLTFLWFIYLVTQDGARPVPVHLAWPKGEARVAGAGMSLLPSWVHSYTYVYNSAFW